MVKNIFVLRSIRDVSSAVTVSSWTKILFVSLHLKVSLCGCSKSCLHVIIVWFRTIDYQLTIVSWCLNTQNKCLCLPIRSKSSCTVVLVASAGYLSLAHVVVTRGPDPNCVVIIFQLMRLVLVRYRLPFHHSNVGLFWLSPHHLQCQQRLYSDSSIHLSVPHNKRRFHGCDGIHHSRSSNAART